MLCGASVMPSSAPVSCTGKNPFGTAQNSTPVSTSVPTTTTSVEVWCRSTHRTPFAYHAIAASNHSSLLWYIHPCSLTGLCRSSFAHIIGVSVSETNALIKIVTASVTANSRNSRPTMSPMNSSGISTAISDTVSDTIVNPICSDPFSAASSGVSPASM